MAPALGVTEPIAIALSTAKAYEAIGGQLKNISVSTDEGVFKNGFSCAVPGTGEKGNEIAAALGVIEETMQNMGKIASPGMVKTNDVILDIMIERK